VLAALALLGASPSAASAASARPDGADSAGRPSPATAHGASVSSGPADPWLSTTSDFEPGDFTRQPWVGNGYLSQRLPAIGAGYQGQLGDSGFPLDNERYTGAFVAGTYQLDGDAEAIAAVPTWSTLDVGVDGATLGPTPPAGQISHYEQALDMRSATVTTSMTWTPKAGRATAIRYEVLANRSREHLGQVRVTVTPAWSGQLSLTVLLDGQGAERITPVSQNVDTAADTSTVRLVTPGDNTGIAETSRLVTGPGVKVADRTAVTPDDTATAGEELTIPVQAGHSYQVTKYVGIATTNDTRSPADLAAATVTDAVHAGWSRLLQEHRSAWARLWAPNLTVAKQPSLQKDVESSFYSLYSSIRADQAWSIAPAGLSSDNYAGVIFWDADTWIFPTLLALHPELARSVVMLRSHEIKQAEANAKAVGYDGGVWSWDNGPKNLCDGYAPCKGYEDHLQSDIALAQWQFYEATGDTSWLRSDGYPVIKDVAEFWASRVTLGDDGKYHIAGVTGPDEYTSGVTDESATNAGAVVSLRDAVTAARTLGLKPDPRWTEVADKLDVVTDADGTHPEYAGYAGQPVKQADTVLMTYPFAYVTQQSVAQGDLDRYAPLTDPGGPAMTASVESVVAAQAYTEGCADYTYLQNAVLPFARAPYDQFLETQYVQPSAGQGPPAMNFMTGAGGFLQTLPYGLAGLRWRTDGLFLDPTLPPQLAAGVSVDDLQYQGRHVRVDIGARTTTVTLLSGSPVTVRTPSSARTLTPHHPVTLPTRRPDLAPTDNLARCQGATATSSTPQAQPGAAVDGSDATVWTAAAATSTLTAPLSRPQKVSHADVTWGPTRPDGYRLEVRAPGTATWSTAAEGAVPTDGDLHLTFPARAADSVRLAFTGSGTGSGTGTGTGTADVASVAELAVVSADSPHVTTTLQAPATLRAGAATTIHADLASDGRSPATGVVSTLTAPAGWTVTPARTIQVGTLREGTRRTVSWQVTPPAGGSASPQVLTVRTDRTDRTAAGGTSSTDDSVSTQVLPPCALQQPCEAEAGALRGGAQAAHDHNGYTGSGFVGNLYAGAGTTVGVDVDTAAAYDVTVRYANWTGGQNPPYLTETRTISLTAAGTTVELRLPTTGSWDTWGTASAVLNLPAGFDPLDLHVTATDTGSVNVDSLTVQRH
jgi:trehalose/maltose hydrolase-like predicted phosphorylase